MAITWTEHANPTTGGTLVIRDFIWAASKFVAVGERSASAVCCMTSADGVTWVLQTAAAANSYRGVTFSPSLTKFVAVSTAGTNRVMTSPDGVTWSPQSAATASAWKAVTWSSTLNLFVAVGTSAAMWSADGISWFSGTGVVAKNWIGIAWSPTLGMFVAAAASSGTASIMTSTDGKAWTGQSHSTITRFGETLGGNSVITWSPTLGMFAGVARIAAGNYTVMTSTNGTAWTAQTIGSTLTLSSIVWAGTQFVVVGQDFVVNDVLTSPDGINWTASSAGDERVWDASAYSSDLSTIVVSCQSALDFVLVGVTAVPVASLSPTSGNLAGGVAAGYTVTIKGNGSNGGFVAGARVFFDPNVHAVFPGLDVTTAKITIAGTLLEAENVTVVDTLTITCQPRVGVARLGGVLIASDVLVINSSLATPNVVFYMIGAFTFLEPIVSSLTPLAGPTSGGTALTFTGTNLYIANIGGNPGRIAFVFSDGEQVFASSVAFVNTTTLTCVTPAWINPTNFFVSVRYDPPGLLPGAEYQNQIFAPSSTLSFTYAADLVDAVAIIKASGCQVTFLPAYTIRLTNAAVYAALVALYGLTTPIILGLSPTAAATMTGAAINTDPSLAAQAIWPQIFVHPSAAFVLGIAISTSVGSGTVAASYGTPFGRATSACWQWRANVEFGNAFLVGEPSTVYSIGLTPPGEVPDGGLLTGAIFGTGSLGPCGG